MEAVLMMLPLPWRSMWGMAWRQPTKVPVTLTSRVRRHRSMGMSVAVVSRCWVAGSVSAALLNSTSRRPRRATAPSITSLNCCSSPISTCTGITLSPKRLASFSTLGSTRSAATTMAPSSLKRSTQAEPMPPPAPVIRMTLSCSRFMAWPAGRWRSGFDMEGIAAPGGGHIGEAENAGGGGHHVGHRVDGVHGGGEASLVGVDLAVDAHVDLGPHRGLPLDFDGPAVAPGPVGRQIIIHAGVVLHDDADLATGNHPAAEIDGAHGALGDEPGGDLQIPLGNFHMA